MRYLYDNIDKLSEQKMLIMTGPRQVGKTELLKHWLAANSGSYFSYDILEDRAKLLASQKWGELLLPNTTNSIIGVDEFHKYSRWKNFLKGICDRYKRELRIVMTGSARLDYFRKGGDSLLGRYENLRLHPFSLGEMMRPFTGAPPPRPFDDWLELDGADLSEAVNQFEDLYKFTGFPEPLFQRDPLFSNRWSRQRLELLVKEDLRDLSQIQEVTLVDHLAKLLPERVGAPFSHQSLVNILQVAHGSVSKWMKWLHALYFAFSIPVYSHRINKSLLKAQKVYLWDYAPLQDEGKRFENLIALALLKTVQYWTDLGYGDYGLWYLRDREGREVDFLITKNEKPLVAIEAKSAPEWPSSLKHHATNLGLKQAVILVREHGIDIRKPGVRMVSASKYLPGLV